MHYYCKDCTHKAKQFPGGHCPACGSSNIMRVGKKAIEMKAEARKPFRISLATFLWIYLAIGVYRQFFMD